MGEYSEDILNNLGREILLDGKKDPKAFIFSLTHKEKYPKPPENAIYVCF